MANSQQIHQQVQRQENPYAAPSEPANRSYASAFAGYAGFWKRFAAVLIDTIILIPLNLILGFVVGIIYLIVVGSAGTPETAELFGNIVGAIIAWLYAALFESSYKQATPGKMALGIMVTETDGKEVVSFGRATGRHFAKMLSTLTLFIGFIMAGFTEKKQALHDMVAGCLVVNRG